VTNVLHLPPYFPGKGKEEPILKLREALQKRGTYELLFAAYLSALIMSVEEMRDFSWSTSLRLLMFSHFHPTALRPIDDPHRDRLIAFILSWLLFALIFLLLRLVARFSLKSAPWQTVAGIVALGGFPAAVLYRGYGNRILLVSMIILSVFCALLYVYQGWRASWRVCIAFLVMYFAISTWVAWHSWNTFPLAFFLLWPGLDWILGTYYWAQNIFLLLGLVFSITWAIYVRETTGQQSL
jgi:hypothetical protein